MGSKTLRLGAGVAALAVGFSLVSAPSAVRPTRTTASTGGLG